MRSNNKIELELLAPSKNAQIAIEAIKHGADAVYIGADKYGARVSAGNTLDDIKTVVDFAHRFNARVYVTINTIIFENELQEVENIIHELYKIGVDALIVQDMGILRMNIPPIALHASTQCDIRKSDKAVFFEKVGFSQIVLARELTLNEIKDISRSTSVALEAFIHGALCVSYSGRCGVSYACMKRSANRGECAQMCRLPYRLEDEAGNVIVEDKHLLSLKDLNRSEKLSDMIGAGVTSFKIEGRLKEMDYVKTIVAYYSNLLDKFISVNNDKYVRRSVGTSEISFRPNPNGVFNRTFTNYFLNTRNLNNGDSIASVDTPKSKGEYIGNVISVIKSNALKVSLVDSIENGDGISYLDSVLGYSGFRVNKIIGDVIYTTQPVKIMRGTRLYRTYNKRYSDILIKETAKRYIRVTMNLRYANDMLALDVCDERGNSITATVELAVPLENAIQPQATKQADVLKKLGNTIYTAEEVNVLPEYFIPNSILADLRRIAIEKLDKAQRINYKYDYRNKENVSETYYTDKLTYIDNVSNSLSRLFYREHGVKEIESALETDRNGHNADKHLMHTRYCILRELGFCRKDKKSPKLSQKLYLVNDKTKLLVITDCINCEMKLYKA